MASFFRRATLAAACAAVTCLPTGVLAQGSSALEEVIVSARKREESILKVPVVMSALTTQQIQDFGIDNLFEVSDAVPGLLINNNVLGIGAQVSLRGVGTSVFDPTIDQSVSLIVDGMQMTQGTAYQAAMFDMAQIEVLKGPQALFFGKASPGGVIHVTTADPGDDLDVIVRTGYETEAEAKQGELIVSGPLTDTFGARLGIQYTDSNGYFKNEGYATPLNEFTGARTPDSEDLAQTEDFIGRLTLKWDPSERFGAKLKYNHTDTQIEGDAGQPQLANCPEGVRSHPTGLTFVGNGEDCDLDDTVHIVSMNPAYYQGFSAIPGFEDRPGMRNGGTPYTDHEQDFGTLELNFGVTDSLELTSVTGLYDASQSSMINATISSADGPAFGVDPDFERDDFTQELRLTSDFADSPVNFVLGGFYQDGKMSYFNNLIANSALLPFPQLQQATQDIDIESESLFGQLLWQATEKLELAAGTRWTQEEREHSINTWLCQFNQDTGATWPTGCAPFSPIEPAPLPTPTPELDSDNYSPEFTATYTPTDDLTFFAALKRAYKSGSFNTVVVPNAYIPGVQSQEVSYGDEEIEGGEVGMKALFLDRQLNVNLSYYDYDFKDMQVGANDNSSGVIAIVTKNAAESTLSGIEMDFTYSPLAVEGLNIRGAFNWNDTEFQDFPNAQCWGGQSFEEGCDQLLDPATGLYNAQDLSGRPLVRAPEYTANIGFDYEQPVFDGGMIARLSVVANYSDEYYTALQQRDDMLQDSYWKSNASVSLRDANEGWEVSLFVNNLTDELTQGLCNPSAAEAGVLLSDSQYGFHEPDTSWNQEDELLCTADNGRQIWLQLTLRPMVLFDK